MAKRPFTIEILYKRPVLRVYRYATDRRRVKLEIESGTYLI
jgi:hypothetical protein